MVVRHRRGKAQALLVGSFAVAIIAGFVLWWMSSGYGQLSERGNELSMVLIRVTNQQDAEGLAGFERLLSDAKADLEISDSEAEIFVDIVELAKAGDWAKASKKTKALMEAQIVRTNELPELD